MPSVRTSKSDPLRVATIAPAGVEGRIGVTPCPGMKDLQARPGPADRDLDLDLDVIQRWGATAVLSLMEDAELAALQVGGLCEAVQDRHMEWWHLPIGAAEASSREFEGLWEVAGEAIRDRLRLGFRVAIHSGSGLGRAGTLAARLLIELGEGCEGAVEQVRGATGADAIGPGPQQELLERCRPAAAASPETSSEAVRDRALGAFLGLAVGDAVGTTLEFTKRDSEPRLKDMIGGGPFKLEAGQWTDDTAMAHALAHSLAANDGLDCADLMDRFVAWMRNTDRKYACNGDCFDIGFTTSEALMQYEKTGDPMAGSTHPRSAGNGSLMRLSPVAVRFWNDPVRLREAAEQQSITTHATPAAVDACAAFADLLADAISGKPRPEVLEPREFDGDPDIARIVKGSWRGLARDEVKSSGYVVHTLEAALWSVARTGNFRNAILLAANLGDDADTVAAVAGQLAGAIYGLAGIPAEWLKRVALRDKLLDVGQLLVEPRR